MKRCPKCGSEAPHLHPSVQVGGEVEVCTDTFHLTITPQNTVAFITEVQRKILSNSQL